MDDKSNFEKAFDRNMSGEKRNLRVWLINPPLENPWRTQGDYRLEQKRETIRFWITITALAISIISVSLTAFIAISKIQGI
ncbi:hypothetical protein [bacterium endosymbiont of Bathymodiolus sp. 5 South]|jgi:hypothetical protein|uniref:hypothetical protein n=1 Tax=bacterium endosymbiont of Bathymodiolus sp. 5 South TaxID=1181670 RepID=UPI0010BB1C0D|nr:hypothetical protein [bacterium endosymbiont of Bathymodiolus sp. 5 South]CAC9438147.1 hypothetical protein [uncultured Gammaproteobacteria bacterium]SHN92503.1 hypothetical protein BCLUESOX_2590 [bacterium endosymbiont of Bathymodiolus sp. 5 South]SSC08673.1 hypothetical protein BTURTLESOX_1995 [bacterium endosymbiont of Bathymodiolus sp. 5 South]VVH56675.1 hypothetical protein BSPCLSOX_2697 [uncultured Gammaproteobacteria bacterium]VVH61999.1 hypothetical protein BSPWISOX_2665 [uncultured